MSIREFESLKHILMFLQLYFLLGIFFVKCRRIGSCVCGICGRSFLKVKTSLLKCSVVVCDAHFKQEDNLPAIRLCIIYSLLLLKTSISLHFLLVERQEARIAAASADDRSVSGFHEVPTASNTIAKALSAPVSCP